MTALEYDPANITLEDGTKLNAYDVLNENATATSIYLAPYVLLALGENATDAQEDAHIKYLCDQVVLDSNYKWGVDGAAIAIAALAPYYDQEDVKTAVDTAIVKMNAKLAEGASEMNTNTDAMVILAYTMLGKDPATAVYSDGVDVVTDMLKTKLEDGSAFGWKNNTAINPMATKQGMLALQALEAYEAGETVNPFDLSATAVNELDLYVAPTPAPANTVNVKIYGVVEGAEEGSAVYENLANTEIFECWAESDIEVVANDNAWKVVKATLEEKGLSYTNEAGDAAAYVTEINGLSAMERGDYSGWFFKHNGEQAPVGMSEEIVAAGDTIIVHYTDTIETKETTSGGGLSKPDEKMEITFSIDTNAISGGYIVKTMTVEVEEGDTAWDITKEILNEKNIEYDYEFTAEFDSVYVKSIDGIGEFDNGSGSGWMFSVNGDYPGYGASKYELEDGDYVRWRYTTNLGEDIGGSSGSGGGGSAVDPEKDKPVIDAIIKEYPTVDNDGNVSVSVSPDFAQDAVKKLEKVSDKVNAQLKIDVKPNEDAKEIETKISSEIYREIAKYADSLVLKTPLAQLIFDDEILEQFNKAVGPDVKIGIVDIKDRADFKAETKALVGNRTVLDIALSKGSTKFTKLDGTMGVSIPYTVAANEDYRKLTVVYIDDNGVATEIKGAKYNLETKAMEFETTKVGTYAIAYDSTKVGFIDVKADDWFANAVNYVVRMQLFNGVTPTTFEPQSNMTRGMFFTVLYRMSGDNDFKATDVWYEAGMNWAKAGDISDGTNPNGNITREQIATMLWRYAGKTKIDSDFSMFKDADKVSEYAIDALKWATANGVVGGNTDGTLNPKGNATRAEVATMIMRYLENVAK